MSVGLDITRQVVPPRAVFLNYPMGNETGFPGDPDGQTDIVRCALTAGAALKEPGSIADLGLTFDGRGPEDEPWEEWVYTKAFRTHMMSTREGTRSGGQASSRTTMK